jgi:hypothetical protein
MSDSDMAEARAKCRRDSARLPGETSVRPQETAPTTRSRSPMAVRAPHLYASLRGFALGAFVLLGRELEEGGRLPFTFDAHDTRRGPALYDYRPQVRPFVEDRESQLRALPDVALALAELRREPAAGVFARAHAGPRPDEGLALFRTILLGLLTAVAETCGGFDWDDVAFDGAYAELERSLFGERRAYVAVAPLVGVSMSRRAEIGERLRVRHAETGEVARHWPEARGLLPPEFGADVDRLCVLELERSLEAGEEPPDAPAELADAVSAIRLATAGPVAAGPVLFERLDGRPFGIRPVLPIAATQPPGEPIRLDALRAELAAEVLARLCLADGDAALAEALDRWELALFQNEPFRSEQLRAALRALLGATAPLRAAVLLEPPARVRTGLHEELVALADGGDATRDAADAVRRALVEVLRDGDRHALASRLDDELLGLRRGEATRLRVTA